MKRYLLDTNIVSAGSPTKSAANESLKSWVEERSREHYISAVTITEIADGVAQLNRDLPGRRALALVHWLADLAGSYGDRVLSIDPGIALAAGHMIDLARGRGHALGLADALIAATAARNDLTLVTRNLRHFQCFGLDLLDPIAPLGQP